MAKLKKIISVSVCLAFFSLTGCGTDINTPPENEDKVTSSANAKYSYSLPLEVILDGECNSGNKVQYSLKENGQFTYNTNTDLFDNTKKDNFITKQLSSAQLKELHNLLKEIDIAKLAEEDQPIPDDAPQTEECRTVQVFTLKVEGKQDAFDLNGRQFTHTAEYTAALQKLNEKLESFKTAQSSYSYALPLKVTHNGECDMGDKTIYELKEDGTFTFAVGENLSAMNTIKLSAGELHKFKVLINDVNIARLSENDIQVPDDAPQTKECRTVESYIMVVNGTEKTYDLNGRNLIHTEEYKNALERLKKGLDSLKDGTIDNIGTAYSLPLKLTLEGECGLGTKNIYTVTSDGNFSYDKNENLDFGDPKAPEIVNKKLKTEQVTELKTLINQLDIAELAEKDVPVPADAGQTADCRTAVNYTINVNGSEKSFLLNDRKATHTDEYIFALEKLRDKLEEFKNECETNNNAFANYIAEDVLMTIERTPCFGFCPTYKLEISGNGKLVFTGIRNTKVEGKAEATISEAKVKELVSEFEKAGYFCLDNEYTDQNVTDLPGAITSIKINGKTKTINHYHGDYSAPNSLKELENKIDEIVNSSQWVNKE